MKNVLGSRTISFVLVLLLTFTSLGAFSGDPQAYSQFDESPVLMQKSDGQDDPELVGFDEEEFLLRTMGDPVGAQGFSEEHEISSYDDIVEIIVQFVTPPAAALSLINEKGIQTNRTMSAGSFEEQALSAHTAFRQQLSDIIPMILNSSDRGQPDVVILSEHHSLFNGM